MAGSETNPTFSQFPVDKFLTWPNNGDQLLSGGNHLDIPTWADAVKSMVILEAGGSWDKSEPPNEMKLISDLWATGIPDSNPMPVDELTNIPFNEPIPHQISIQSALSKISAMNAVVNIGFILRPPRLSGKGCHWARLNQNLQTWIEDMLLVLCLFLTHEQWIKASQQVVVTKGWGSYGRVLCHWIHSFILDPTSLPANAWASRNVCCLDTEDGLQEELWIHL